MPVIVSLYTETDPPTPESIAKSQSEVMAALAGYPVERLRQYRSLPQMAMTVRSDALSVLLASPVVRDVQPDGLASTFSPEVESE